MRRIRWILLLAIAALLAALIGLTMAHRSSARKALARYKAQLRSKGEKLTFEELRSSFSSNQPDTLSVLTGATRKFAGIALQPGTWDWMHYVRPGSVRVAWDGLGPLRYYDVKRTEASADWMTVASGFDEAEEAMAALREAMEHPAANEGPYLRRGIFNRPVTSFVDVRTAGQWLAGQTLNDLHLRNRKAAVADVRAITGLANLNREECWLVHQMIRVAVGGLGLSVTWQALQAPGWSEAELAALQTSWGKVDFLQAIEQGWLGERAIGTALWEHARSNRWSALKPVLTGSNSSLKANAEAMLTDYILFPFYRVTSMDEDELFRLRVMQGGIETAKLLRLGQSWQKARVSSDTLYAEINSLTNAVQRFRYWLTLFSTPNFQKAFQTSIHNEIQRRMTITAIALKRYELAHDKPPPTLEALVPEFLSAVPIDLMSGQPLRYRLNPDGSFVLYSVGEDGVDDGGDPNPPSAGGRFGLWEGKDAVWPSAAAAEDETPKRTEK